MCIGCQQISREWAIIYNHTIYVPTQIMMNLVNKIGGFKAICFAVFGHQVTDVDFLRFRFAYGPCDVEYKQVGYKAGIEIAGTDDNCVRSLDSTYCLGASRGIFRLQGQARNWRQGTRILLA